MPNVPILAILKRVFLQLTAPSASLLAGAIAFYAMLSLAPVLYIAIWVVGLIFGTTRSRHAVVSWISDMAGRDTANIVNLMIQQASQQSGDWLALLTGVVIALYAGSRVFLKLQDALNTLWHVRERPLEGVGAHIRFFVQKRLLSMAMVFGVGAFLFLLIVAKTILALVIRLADQWIPELAPTLAWIWPIADLGITTMLGWLLFGTLYRMLPDVKIRWSHVWLGAAMAAVLFTVGSTLLGSFVTRSSANTVPGAASSLIAVLLWAYYSAFVFFIGAAISYSYAVECGDTLEPEEYAESLNGQPLTCSRPR